MKRVELLPSALAEFEAAAQWYEAKRPGLGLDFVDRVEAQLLLIGEQPNRFPRWEEDSRYRKAKVTRFPYVLFYLERGDVVHVVAVAHGRRAPGYWQKRGR